MHFGRGVYVHAQLKLYGPWVSSPLSSLDFEEDSRMKRIPAICFVLCVASSAFLAALTTPIQAQDAVPTRADTLRGSNGPARSWWDVMYYDLNVAIDKTCAVIEQRRLGSMN